MLTIKMNFFSSDLQDLQGLRISSTTNKIVEYDVAYSISDAEIVDILDLLFSRFNHSPSQVCVNGSTSALSGEIKAQASAARQKIFKAVLDRGYKRKYQSPFTAVRSSRFKAVVSDERQE